VTLALKHLIVRAPDKGHLLVKTNWFSLKMN